MSILSGPEIRRQMALGTIKIEPPPQSIGPNSADLTLGPVLKRYRRIGADHRRAPGWIWDSFGGWVMDAKSPPELEDVPQKHGGWLLNPGYLYLGSTAEYTETHGFVPLLDGRSSLGRLGVFAHVTAGIGDDGWCGRWTVELVVVAPIVIYPGGRYFQCVYHTLEGDRQPYTGRYQGDTGPVGSRIALPGGDALVGVSQLCRGVSEVAAGVSLPPRDPAAPTPWITKFGKVLKWHEPAYREPCVSVGSSNRLLQWWCGGRALCVTVDKETGRYVSHVLTGFDPIKVDIRPVSGMQAAWEWLHGVG